MKRLYLLVVILIFAACDRPGDHPITTNCTWVEADSRTLNLTAASDRRHLRSDAVTAEDIAIRWADKYFGHLPEWDQRCAQCMETLFQGVAQQHGVDIAVVRQYSVERDAVVDTPVILIFAAFYAAAAYLLAGRIRKRFPPGEPGYWVMTLTLALGVSLAGLAFGNLWSIVIEEIRMNSGHLSYRMNRLPFRRYWEIVVLCGIGVFALVALIRSRVPAVTKVLER